MIFGAPILLIAYGVGAIFLGPDERLLFTPIVLSSTLILASLELFWRRDRHLPIFDVGVVCALVSLTYAAVPALFYWKSGLAWTDLSDYRLVEMRTTPDDVARVLWLVTAYLAALVVSYGLLRGKGMPGPDVAIDIRPRYGWALFAIVMAALVYRLAIETIFDVSLITSNEALQDNYGVQQLPHFVAQVTHNAIDIGRIAKLGLIAFAISQKKRWVTILLMLWLMFEAYGTLTTLGARTYLAMLLLAVIFAYHRLVKPIGGFAAVGAGSVLVAALLAYGFMRDLRSDVSGNDLWSAVNEFQVLLANALHAPWAYDRGIISDVPSAIRFSDLIMLIPQQLLPFQKLDPSDWYVDQIGATDSGVGLMFGVVAQAGLGYGLPEIMIRGALLGAVLAFVHRRCARNAASFTAFMIYLWLCVSVYYTYRATTFYIASYAVYRLIPFLLLFSLLVRVLERRKNGAVSLLGRFPGSARPIGGTRGNT